MNRLYVHNLLLYSLKLSLHILKDLRRKGDMSPSQKVIKKPVLGGVWPRAKHTEITFPSSVSFHSSHWVPFYKQDMLPFLLKSHNILPPTLHTVCPVQYK
jgi:hypothetical protein